MPNSSPTTTTNNPFPIGHQMNSDLTNSLPHQFPSSFSPILPSSSTSSRDSSPSKHRNCPTRGDLVSEPAGYEEEWPPNIGAEDEGEAATANWRRQKWRRRRQQSQKRINVATQSCSSSSLLSLISSSSGIGDSSTGSCGTDSPPSPLEEAIGPQRSANPSRRCQFVQQQDSYYGGLPTPGLLFLDISSNPTLHQFYIQQRLFYRQFYAQQLSAILARFGHIPPPIWNAQRQNGRREGDEGDGGANSKEIGRKGEKEENDGKMPAENGGQKAADEHMAYRVRHVSNTSTKCSGCSILLPADENHSKPPFTSGGISCMDVLSEHIYNFHQNIEQNTYQLNRKLMLRDQLYYAISPIFPMCGLYVVGSSLNGFGTSRSDLDLCLMITPRDIDQKTDAIIVLTAVMEALNHHKIVVNQQLITAKVPILRIKCDGVFSDIMVDLNVNNAVAIQNTHLLCHYSSFDWRVRPIVMVIKEWAKRRGINNASRSTFTSYSLVLMVIHYLQCGANPPVLPSLQQLYPHRFNNQTDVSLLNVSQSLEPQPGTLWNFDQRLSLSELLLGFLKYFAFDFDFDKDAISIRLGRKLPRSQVTQNQSPFNSLTQWHCICIEEPFTLSNAAHSVYDERIFEEIKKTFADSYHELEKHRDLENFLGKLISEPNDGNGTEIALQKDQNDYNNDEKDEST